MIDRLVIREGGFDALTNHASDRGGWTRAGITLARFSDYLGRQATVDDLRALTPDQIRTFYGTQYLAPFEFITNEKIKEFCFDYAVNSGVKTAIKTLQTVVGTPADGIVGPKTIAAVDAAHADQLFHLLWIARQERYFRLAFEEPSVRQFLVTHEKEQLHNLRGWLRRISEFVN